MVRYELEKALLQGTLAVADLPAAWNEKYRQYLGVEVPDDARGCLQDIHWAMGDFGYFPSYALGSAYAAQAVAGPAPHHGPGRPVGAGRPGAPAGRAVRAAVALRQQQGTRLAGAQPLRRGF